MFYPTWVLPFLFVALAGMGAGLRWVLTHFMGSPVSTLVVNIVGSLLIGFVFCHSKELSEDSALALWKVPLMVGFLGALTTYSSFSLECLEMLHSQNYRSLLLYATSMNALCLLGCWLGYRMGEAFPLSL